MFYSKYTRLRWEQISCLDWLRLSGWGRSCMPSSKLPENAKPRQAAEHPPTPDWSVCPLSVVVGKELGSRDLTAQAPPSVLAWVWGERLN